MSIAFGSQVFRFMFMYLGVIWFCHFGRFVPLFLALISWTWCHWLLIWEAWAYHSVMSVGIFLDAGFQSFYEIFDEDNTADYL